MTPYRFRSAAFALALLPIVFPAPKLHAAPVPAEPAAYGQEPWAIPPREFNEIQRRAFLDGIEGARRDYGNHRNPDVNNREEFRNPNVPPDVREIYRAAFRRGYETGASRWWGTPPPPPPVAPQPPAAPEWGMRGLQSEAEHQGYREGMEAARRDFQSQRRPDPDDHEEFRTPHVPPGLTDEYREGFMRGYEVAMSQLHGEDSWQVSGDPDQWAAPQRFSELQRRGFHDGVEGARHDFGNHRRPNVANREEYREPHLDRAFWPEYREGFRRGYEMAASRLWGGM
jgi:hypothetical protein